MPASAGILCLKTMLYFDKLNFDLLAYFFLSFSCFDLSYVITKKGFAILFRKYV